MAEGWGMVAAAAIALVGVLCGLFIGRRQVRDQAQVEHGQWLRGQRQEAYANFLTAWNEMIPKFESRILDEQRIEDLDRASEWDEARSAVADRMEEDQRPLQQAAERVLMLGPESVDQVVNAMLGTVTELVVGIEDQYIAPNNLQTYWSAVNRGKTTRSAFVTAARTALHQAPDTARR
ncbi:hypothetical protein OG345_42160 (plasmid) [Streptomyces sp. NBC_01220]|uniref:hypothetical protein n=1 Tax=Streptomyces sp. NBC_01220 TaxID=2903781 RepID=UPI00352C51CE|nr:hypothetical protein OG345_42160 [Streptomyces sp. NBC_01220]